MKYLAVVAFILCAAPVFGWSHIDDVILAECRAQGVPFAMAEAQIGRESSWNPKAIGDDGGSVGLSQLQVAYLPWFAKMFNGGRDFDPFNADMSAKIGIRYLSWLHGLFGDWWLALVAYNEGPTLAGKGIYYAQSMRYATAILKEVRQ